MAAAKAVAVIRGNASLVPPSLSAPLTSPPSTINMDTTTLLSSSSSSEIVSSSIPITNHTHHNIHGIIRFQQPIQQSESLTRISGRITGLTPGKHGLHIVIYGDESDPQYRAMGGIYNPYSKPHSDRVVEDDRAIGALGNIEANQDGIAIFDFYDNYVKLIGPLSVLGRSIVIKQHEDDGGKGSSNDSLIDGNSGAIIAAGVIGISAIPIL